MELTMKKANAPSTYSLIGLCLLATIIASVLVVSTRSSRAASFYSTIKSWVTDPQTKGTPPKGAVGPVSVTATAGTTGPTDYATLKAAFDAINAGTHLGNINISIVGDTTETAPAVLNASGSGSAAYTSIMIQPSGGAPRTISGAIAAGSPLIDFNGADQVIVDGLNTGGNSLTIANTTVSAVSITSTIRFIGGATSNTITNSNLQGSVSSSVATNGAVIFFSTDAVTASGNDNNTISNNNIGPAGSNLPTKAILGNGSQSTTAIGNSGIIISNNNIFDYFGAAVTSSGIATNGGCNTWTITSNRFYQTGTRTWTTGALHRAIDIRPSTATQGAQGFTITGNIIGYASNTQTGTYTLTGSTGGFVGILFTGITGGTVSDISSNTVASVSLTGVTSSGTSTSSPFSGIIVTNGLANTNSNTIGSSSTPGSMSFNTTAAAASDVYGIFYFPSAAVTMSNNIVGGITATNSNATPNVVDFYGLRAFTTSSVTNTMQNNTVGFSAAPIANNSTNSASNTYGIYSQSGASVVTGNTVSNMTMVAPNVGTGSSAAMIGIWSDNTSATIGNNISQNTIRSLSDTDSAAAVWVTGLQYNGSTTGIHVVQRNFIHTLSTPSTSATATINGINIQAGTTTYQNNIVALGTGLANGPQIYGINEATAGTDNLYHNSIYIGGTGVGGSANTWAFQSSITTNTRSYRDNIFFNARSNGAGTGKHYALTVGGTTPNPAGLTINNNDYFSNGTGGVFGRFNALDVANLAAWKTAVGQDAGSFEANPQYLDQTNAVPDLHIHPTNATVVEGNGADVGVTNDFDGQTRASFTPVDIGADAGNFNGIDLAAPGITYIPLVNTSVLTNRILSVTITDVTGVATGGLAPRIYFNKNAGTYFSTACSLSSGTVQNGVWNCTIDNSLVGGVVATDVIRYFVVAQDTLGNLAANPSGGFTGTDVNTVTTPPTTPNSYTIVMPFTGSFNVGTGETFTSLTNTGGIFEAINAGALTGNVTINITTDLTAELGTVALNQWAEDGVGGYSMLIKPSGAPRMIVGTNTGALIRLNGADRVTIDGSTAAMLAPEVVGGNSALRQLTIQNTNTGTSAVVVSFGSGTNGAQNDTLKNVNVLGQDPTTTLVAISLGGTTPGTPGTDNDNNRIENCSVKRAIFGIYSAGASLANQNTGTVITMNETSDVTADRIRRVGILVFNDNGVQITENSINGISTNESADGIGIGVGTQAIDTTLTTAGGVTNALVARNKINGVASLSATGFSAAGITVAGATGGANTIQNNFITGVTAPSTAPDIPAGIYVVGAAGSSTRLYHNSIAMTGDRGGVASQTPGFGVAITGTDPTVELKNNIFYTTQVAAGGGVNAKSYAIGMVTTTFVNLDSNYNDFFSSGANAGFFRSGSLAAAAGTDYATVALWGTAVSDDANSQEIDPIYVNPLNDLHLNGVTTPLLGDGITGFATVDFDNDPRPASNPDIGADELVQATAGSFAAGTYYNVSANDGDSLGGNVTVTNMLTLNGKLSTGANTLTIGCNASISGAGAANYVIGNLKKTYCGTGAFNFVVGTANGFSPVMVNVTAGTFPADFTVKATQGPQPNIGTPTHALQRYWTLTATGVTADLTFNYLDPTDIPAMANENIFVILKYDGAFTMPGGSVNTVANTANITGVTSFSDWTLAEPGAPTDVALNWFTADAYSATPNSPNGGALLRWQSGLEVANLGFNIYRDQAGERVRVTPDMIAGSAFFVGARTVLSAGRSYVWRDTQGSSADAEYWLESVDINGFSAWYGPVRSSGVKKLSADFEPNSKLMHDLGEDRSAPDATTPVETKPKRARLNVEGLAVQAAAAAQPAVKIYVRREGWYRIAQSELVAAGLDARVDPLVLRLLVDGQEQPISVLTDKDGRLTGIEFYGVGADSPYTSLRTYWLAAGVQPGKRIERVTSAGTAATGGSFPYAVERRDRTIYFAALRNGDKENFFGSVIARDPVDQSLTVQRLDTGSNAAATLEVALQGVTTVAHSVKVELNGSFAGAVSFNSQLGGVGRFNVPPSLLKEGQNVVRLTSQFGQGDVSLVDYIRLTYPHRYTAESDALRFTVAGKQQITIDGFSSSAIRVLDVTNPNSVQELIGTVQPQQSGYAVALNLQSSGQRTLLAIAGEMARPVSLAANIASTWRQPANGADMIILTRRDFFAALGPLLSLRQKQGYSVALVDIEDVYDEFSYGQKTPQAVKDFCAYAAANWKKAPRFVMLAGDASLDPKNYLGFGDADLVPTRLVDTQLMETASDDWLVDFNGDLLPDMAIGRLPVRSADEALRLATKIAGYDGQRSAATLLLVADHNDTYDFESASNMLRGLVPPTIRIETVERAHLDDATAKAMLIDAINRGQVIVNYTGHGSVDQWRANILTSADAAGLTNAGGLSMFVMMTCLNGYFQDAALDSLAESLLKADGGAVAVW